MGDDPYDNKIDTIIDDGFPLTSQPSETLQSSYIKFKKRLTPLKYLHGNSYHFCALGILIPFGGGVYL